MKDKKIFTAVLLAILLCLCASTVFAGSQDDVIVSVQIGNPVMEVNGRHVEIDAGRDTKPVITNGRTLLPIRAIIEAFGGTVSWEDSTKTVQLNLQNHMVLLGIDSNVAYLNHEPKALDVAPLIINGRTMLPIRFVAESFNLGVAWDDSTKTVSIIRSTFDANEYARLMADLPPYSGEAYTRIHNNVPFFETYEIINGSFEYYSTLDALGRCDVCFASIGEDLMPTNARESISSITPTGWENERYDCVEGGYLYNRCHLIGFQLTGENANERNLITGTRYLNVEGMLPFENQIADYIERTGNQVMYRSTPVFTGENLVCDGVLLEAYSVEDKGKGISFCVYCYNVQPEIEIDYQTGKNALKGDFSKKDVDRAEVTESVYRTPSGKRYHYDAECGGKNSFQTSLEKAKEAGLTPCAKCAA